MPTSTSLGLDETWRLLRQHLSWLDSHWIGFLATPDPRIANTLAERADWQLRSRGRMVIRFQPRSPEELGAMLPQIEAALGGAHGCLWVEAVRGARAGDDWADGWAGLLQTINQRRDSIRLGLTDAGLLLVGPPVMVDLARRLAPDVWSVRSLHLEVAGEPGPVVYREDHQATAVPEPGRIREVVAADARSEEAMGVLRLIRESARFATVGDPGSAVERSQEALGAARASAPALIPAATWQLAVSSRQAGDIGGALAAAEQLTEVIDGDGSREQAFDLLAELRAEVADHCGAEAAYGESLEIRRRLAATVGTAEADRDLSVSLDNLGRVREARGDWAGAEVAYGESLEIRRRLAATVGTAEADRDVSVSVNNLERVQEKARTASSPAPPGLADG